MRVEGLWFGTGGVGERAEGARVWTHSATSVTEEVYVSGPTKRGVLAQGGDPTGLEVGASGVEVVLTRGQTKAGSHLGDTA